MTNGVSIGALGMKAIKVIVVQKIELALITMLLGLLVGVGDLGKESRSDSSSSCSTTS